MKNFKQCHATNRPKFLAFFLFFALLSISYPALSQEDGDEQANSERNKKQYIYQKPTVAKFSQMYWALGKFKDATPEEENKYLDNYLMINECNIYKDYYNNEFEWKTVRDSARTFIAQNKKTFPLRYEFIQPLRFGEYDTATKEFAIQDEFAIKPTRSFEFQAQDFEQDICNYPYELEGYPKSLYVELNRPFFLAKVPVREDLAMDYIKSKSEILKSLPHAYQNQEILYKIREAYLVMRITIFAYRETIRPPGESILLAKTLGALDSYEVYADRDLKRLLYADSAEKKITRSKKEEELKRKYKERLEKKILEMKAKKAQKPLTSEEPKSKALTAEPPTMQ